MNERDDDEVCTCGHLAFFHVNFGNAECDNCPCPQFQKP